MSTDDQNQTPARGGEQEQATGAAAAPQTDASNQPAGQPSGGARGERHGRRRHNRSERRPQQQQSQPRRTEPALNIDELRELTELFSSHGLTDFEFENADIRIRLARNPAPVVAAAPAAVVPAAALNPLAAMQTAAAGVHAQAVPHASEAAKASGEEAQAEEELHVIPSPIVGTFYRSPAPNAEPFVKVGSHVEQDTVVCIIEAMKLMNEILAETTGTIAKIYVENGQPVEYDQPLFGVKK